MSESNETPPADPVSQITRVILAVAVYLALLSTLLLPAVYSVRRTSRAAEIWVDTANLESAVAQFKVHFGVIPPSAIRLYATEAEWDSDQSSRRCKGLIKQLWPKFDFSNCGGMSRVPEEGVTLDSCESLVFFLGGIINSETHQLIGFSCDQEHPFAVDQSPRQGPFFDFRGEYDEKAERWKGRLIDQDGDGFCEYLDPWPGQTKPYLYASGEQSYRYEETEPFMREVYRTNRESLPRTHRRPYKTHGLQIISPGYDGQYGDGGFFDPNQPHGGIPIERRAEWDNFTNFHSGTLGDVGPPVEFRFWKWIAKLARTLPLLAVLLLVGFAYSCATELLFGIVRPFNRHLQTIIAAINLAVFPILG